MNRSWRSRYIAVQFIVASLLLGASWDARAQTSKPVVAPAAPTAPAASSQPSASRTLTGRVAAISEDQSSLVVTSDKKDGTGKESQPIAITAKALQALLKNFRVGDAVRVEITQEGAQTILREIGAAESVRVSVKERWIALGIGLAVLVLFALVLLGGDVRGLLLGADGRYSNSKVQMALWFGALIITYIALLWLRWWKGAGVGGVSLAQNLLLISGMSALTFGAAKGITTAKIQAREEREIAAGSPPAMAALLAESAVKPPATPAERGLIKNLVRNDDGRVDIGDFQMVVVTILAVLVYVGQVYEFSASIEK